MIKRKQISLIVTVFNEELTIDRFLNSVFQQTTLPSEVVIVDGGSTDRTVELIKKISLKNKWLKIILLIKPGNRSIGRNEAIKSASGTIILCTDAGCILDRNWVKKIILPFNNSRIDVVAGYYKAKARTTFHKSLTPYVLVMEDKIKENDFLPATRSMAFTKRIWRKVGGFNEKLSHNEDYFFSNLLKIQGANFAFAKNAIVYWLPRNNIIQAFIMFFRFSLGDIESGIIRGKVLLIFLRYFYFFYLISMVFLMRSPFLFSILLCGIVIYLIWAVKKNYKYVLSWKAFLYLPALQIVSDIAVLTGSICGLARIMMRLNRKIFFKKYKIITILILIYVGTMLSIIATGLPGSNHPFTYQMDEWHQMQAVRNVFEQGSPNVEGAANGSMFHFFLSGILLIPFIAFNIINPSHISSAIGSVNELEKLFIVLRGTTLFFGIMTIIVLARIAQFIKINSKIVVLLFIFNPAWLVLSNFFKYDIGLTFWITFSLYFFLKYQKDNNIKSFLIASFLSGVAFAVKVSALPLIFVIVLSIALSDNKIRNKLKFLIIGLSLFIFTGIFLGLLDLLFAGKNMNVYLYENIILSSRIIPNYILKDSLAMLTLLKKLPAIFGHPLYLIGILSLVIVIIQAINDFRNKKYLELKVKILLLSSFAVFALSLIPLAITVSANRVVVLIPFAVLIIGMAFTEVFNNIRIAKRPKILGIFLLIILLLVQIYESYLWIIVKFKPSPQELSSEWIKRNVPAGTSIGIENVPIYQFPPDLILKEFYEKQYEPARITRYHYKIIDPNSNEIPEIVVLSNVAYEKMWLKKSPKNEIVKRLSARGYNRIAYFPLIIENYSLFDTYFYYPYIGLFAVPDGISIYKRL